MAPWNASIDRLREEPCGCRYDVVTGIYTHFCAEHRLVGRKRAAAKRARRKGTPLTHMGVPISRDDADRISKDGP